jgi:predicted outer membrane lipoprotein
MSTTLTPPGSTLGVLAGQEIRNYLRHKLFWFGTAMTGLVVVSMFAWDDTGSAGAYMIGPGAMLGVLGLVVMFGLTRRSDRAAQAAGAVAVPERVRTLALAAAVVVPFTAAMVAYVAAVVAWYVRPPHEWVVPPGVSNPFVLAQMFGDGVMCAVGGPLLGLLLARYLPRRGVAAIASVLLVLVTIMLQGNFAGGQPYRVFWFWTYFIGQLGWSPDPGGSIHFRTAPGNPFIWVLYLVIVCALGVVAAVFHDPESDRTRLRNVALGLLGLALLLGVLTMTVGYTDVLVNPIPCGNC